MALAQTGATGGPDLADELRLGTRELHVQAERSGIIAALLRGTAPRSGYILLLRNLLPAYRAMEAALSAHSELPAVAPIARAEVYRQHAIESDLVNLHGPAFETEVPELPESIRYVHAIEGAARRDPRLLAAHAYTRYLGDLNGGTVLHGLLRSKLALDEHSLAFYRFTGIEDLTAFKARYRADIGRMAVDDATVAAIVEEARGAFRHNIAVSESVARHRVVNGRA